MVMKRIPFDRDAIMISPREAVRLAVESGLQRPPLARSLFYLPHCLAWLRPAEVVLHRLLLGAQYCVLARKCTAAAPKGASKGDRQRSSPLPMLKSWRSTPRPHEASHCHPRPK